jgi:hypothetical protein
MSAADLSDDVLAATARQRLIALFVVYDSSALTKVDRLLGEFSGRERNLFRVLASRFGISLDQALHVGTSAPYVAVFPMNHVIQRRD